MKRTPTGSVAILVSWIVIFSGISLAVVSYSSKSWGILSIILATSFAVSIILRLLTNMNEFLFSLNGNIYSLVNKIDEESLMFQGMSTALQGVNKGVQESNQTLQGVNKGVQESSQTLQGVNKGVQESNQMLQGVNKGVQESSQTLQQSSCDSKDINQNLHKLTFFFEEIERHLDLKK